jgi:hypothetical protein
MGSIGVRFGSFPKRMRDFSIIFRISTSRSFGGARDPSVDQPLGGGGHLVDRPLEELLVRLRRLVHPAQLPDELERRGADLVRGRRRREIGECSNVSAHADTLTAATFERETGPDG